MLYATPEAYVKHFQSFEAVERSNWRGDEWSVDQEFLTTHLYSCSRQIDSVLAVRFATPFGDPVPPILVEICCEMTRWEIERTANIKEESQTHYDQARAMLAALAAGTMILLDVNGLPVSSNPGNIATLSRLPGFQSGDRRFLDGVEFI